MERAAQAAKLRNRDARSGKKVLGASWGLLSLLLFCPALSVCSIFLDLQGLDEQRQGYAIQNTVVPEGRPKISGPTAGNFLRQVPSA